MGLNRSKHSIFFPLWKKIQEGQQNPALYRGVLETRALNQTEVSNISFVKSYLALHSTHSIRDLARESYEIIFTCETCRQSSGQHLP